jgi:transposase
VLSDLPGDYLLKPQEVANIFGVRTTTVALWARAGRLPHTLTVRGHRRYRWADVRALPQPARTDPEQEKPEQDATRLYLQGCGTRRVATEFECSYRAMRRILQRRTTLRNKHNAPAQRFRASNQASGLKTWRRASDSPFA